MPSPNSGAPGAPGGSTYLSLAQALALGVLQGPAEALPVSSSGHLALLPWLLGWHYERLEPDLRKGFEVALHAGAGAALAFVFRAEARELVRARGQLMLALAPHLVDMTRAEASPALKQETPGALTPLDPNTPNYSRSGSFGDRDRIPGFQQIERNIIVRLGSGKLFGGHVDDVLAAFQHIELGIDWLFEALGFLTQDILYNHLVAGMGN